MKKLLIFLCVIIFVAITYVFTSQYFPIGEVSSEKKESYQIQKNLQVFHPIQEDLTFVVLVLAENAVDFCERQLKSIFAQTYTSYRVIYLDNGSSDGTMKKIKQVCEAANKQDKLHIVRYEQKNPDMQIIYETIHEMNPHEIVVYLEGHDWLAHENVLDHLNYAYANSDVWLTYSRTIHHPDYQQVEGNPCSDAFLRSKKLRKKGSMPFPSLFTFPVAYFKEIRLEDLLFNGQFVQEKALDAFLFPLFEMGPEHILFMDEVMLVKNDLVNFETHKEHLHQLMATESYLRSLPSYADLHSLKLHIPTASSLYRPKGDVLIFSEDSPLHLYACLESLYLKVRGINEIYVIYQSHDHEFSRAYLNLKSEFPSVQFMDICDYPGSDFQSLMKKALANRRQGAPYLLITDDHHIFDQKLKLYECIEALEKVHASHFFLMIDEGFLHDPLPVAIQISEGVYAWQMGEEGQKQSPYMCICRKAILGDMLGLYEVKDLSAFKELWKKNLSSHTVALFHEEKKVLPLKLGYGETLTQKKHWGHKFIEGYKIDLPSLLCEIDEIQDGKYPLIKREKCQTSMH